MHRVLVITLGRGLEPLHVSLSEEYAERVEAGMLPAGDMEAEFILAPVEGVGNLSRPVEVLRQRLFDEIASALTRLLTLRPGRKGEFVVDVFLVTNHGEALASNADMVVFDAVRSIIDEKFSPLFPKHRRGADRRWRLIPIVLLPADGQTPRPRREVLDAAREQHDRLAKLREERSEEADAPIDRIFVLDAITQYGIATWPALLDQAANFVRFVLFSGMRRDENVIRWLEAPGPDLPASFGIGVCRIRPRFVRNSLMERFAVEVADALNEPTRADLPALNELLRPSAADDDEIFEETLAALELTPSRVLSVDGPGALPFVIDLYRDAIDRIERWQEEAIEKKKRPKRDNDEPEASVSGGWVSLLTTLLAGGVFAAGHLLAGLTIVASAGAAAFIGLLAAFVLWLVWSSVANRKNALTTPKRKELVEHDDKRLARIELLLAAARSSHRKAATLRERLQHVRAGLGIEVDSRWFPERVELGQDEGEEEEAQGLNGASAFVCPLDTATFIDVLFERFNPHSDQQRAAYTFLETLASWRQLVDGDQVPMPENLCIFAESTFATIFEERLFSHPESREALAPALEEFLETWKLGPPEFLEFESGLQRDANGFRHVFDRAVFVPADLESLVTRSLNASELTIQLSDASLHDVFVVDATTDIALDAIAVLSPPKA